MKKLGIVIFTILFVISSALLIFFYTLKYSFALRQSEDIDPQYATAVFEKEIQTQVFEFDAFSCLYFLNDYDPLTNFSKKTDLLNATPTLKIVNSNEYRVEITSNSDAFDKLKIATGNRSGSDEVALVITFTDDCYVPVYTDDVSYDYDTGLYVDFDKFEVVVYAPISTLHVDSKVILDYDAPTCEEMYVMFSYEGTDANIYNVNTNKFTLHCSGTSDITLSGNVQGESKIMIWHDTKIDANDFVTKEKDFTVSSAFLGEFSYIKYNHIFHIGFFNGNTAFPLILIAFLHFSPVLWLVCLIFCIRKFIQCRSEKVK